MHYPPEQLDEGAWPASCFSQIYTRLKHS